MNISQMSLSELRAALQENKAEVYNNINTIRELVRVHAEEKRLLNGR